MVRTRRIESLIAVLAVAGCVAAAYPVRAGAFESELGSDPAKLKSDVKLSMMNGDGNGSESGRGPVPYLKALGAPPKRVGLISFYVWDCGNKKENSYNIYAGDYVYRTKTTRRRNVEAAAVDMLATELHDASIVALKDAFASGGMQLLTPDEFLDTDAKKELYAGFKPEHGGMETFIKSVDHWADKDSWKFSGAPDGYRVLELTNVGDVKGNHFQLATTGIGVGKVANSEGHDFAQQLGLDAVVILYNVVQAENKDIRMRGSYMYMFGPNPVPDTGQSLYWRGHQYSGVYLRMDVPFIKTTKDGQLVDADYSGYAAVASALGARMAEHLREKTSGN